MSCVAVIVAGAGGRLRLILRVVIAGCEVRADTVDLKRALRGDVVPSGVRVRVRDVARRVVRADPVRGRRLLRRNVLVGLARRQRGARTVEVLARFRKLILRAVITSRKGGADAVHVKRALGRDVMPARVCLRVRDVARRVCCASAV